MLLIQKLVDSPPILKFLSTPCAKIHPEHHISCQLSITHIGYWGALKDAVNLLKDLSILEKVASKLINKPDVAAKKLAVVLSEPGKSYQALDDALVNLAALSFESHEAINESRRYLLEAQGGTKKSEHIAFCLGCDKGFVNEIGSFDVASEIII